LVDGVQAAKRDAGRKHHRHDLGVLLHEELANAHRAARLTQPAARQQGDPAPLQGWQGRLKNSTDPQQVSAQGPLTTTSWGQPSGVAQPAHTCAERVLGWRRRTGGRRAAVSSYWLHLRGAVCLKVSGFLAVREHDSTHRSQTALSNTSYKQGQHGAEPALHTTYGLTRCRRKRNRAALPLPCARSQPALDLEDICRSGPAQGRDLAPQHTGEQGCKSLVLTALHSFADYLRLQYNQSGSF